MELNGLFEIHISVNPEGNYVKLINFVKKYEQKKGMKIVHAVSSNSNNQYMLSYFTRKTDEKLAVDSANQIAKEMENDFQIKVVRVKVEGHNARGTPNTKEEYDNMCKYLGKKYSNIKAKPYFEFHTKIINYDTKLDKIIEHFNGVAISFNMCSASKNPLLTVRYYNDGFNKAEEYKDYIMNTLKTSGYIFGDKIQQEFSVYDTYPKLDEGWLVYM